MIVERWTWQVNPAHKSEFIELTKALVQALGMKPRVCSYRFGVSTAVSSDMEFETFLDREKYWERLDTSIPEWVEFHEKHPDLVETGTTCELLIVH
jgi:hypothetical protein